MINKTRVLFEYFLPLLFLNVWSENFFEALAVSQSKSSPSCVFDQMQKPFSKSQDCDSGHLPEFNATSSRATISPSSPSKAI